jgi:methionine biosynthesis protein MetW
MSLTTPKNSTVTEFKASVQHGEINYSVERLQMDDAERAHIRRELSEIKKQYGITNCTVLEVGCGLGSNLEVFRPDNRVVGIEGLADAVAVARSRGLEAHQGDLESELCLNGDSVDWVLCLDVLEHLENPIKLMVDIHRVLRVGGRIIINVPNHFNLKGRIKLLFGHDLDVHNFFPESHEWDNPHLRFFTHGGISQLLRAAGFGIVEDRSAHFWSFPKGRFLERMGLRPVLRRLALLNPGLFAGGFLIIGKKQ